jgi:hypothetical protein
MGQAQDRLSLGGGRGQLRMTYKHRRPGPLRVEHRLAAPPGIDHQDRVRPRPPIAGRGRLALPDRAPESARTSPSAKMASRPWRSRSPGPPNSDCTAPGRAWKPARSAARSSPSPPPASSPDTCGRSPKSNSHNRQRPCIPSAGSVAARHARGTRDGIMSNPPSGRPRSMLDGGSPRRTMVLRQLNREYQSDPRRAQHAGPPPTQPTTHPLLTPVAKARNSGSLCMDVVSVTVAP